MSSAVHRVHLRNLHMWLSCLLEVHRKKITYSYDFASKMKNDCCFTKAHWILFDERRIHEIRKGTELYFFVQSRDVWSDLVLYSHDRYAVEHLSLPFDLKSNYRVLWSWNHYNARRANKKILSCESHHQIIVILYSEK